MYNNKRFVRLFCNDKINSQMMNIILTVKNQHPCQSFNNILFSCYLLSASLFMRFFTIPPTFCRHKCCLKFDVKISEKSWFFNIKIKNSKFEKSHVFRGNRMHLLPVPGSLVGVGDVISQQLIERRGVAHHNMRRTAKMMSIGFFFVVSCIVMATAPGQHPGSNGSSEMKLTKPWEWTIVLSD